MTTFRTRPTGELPARMLPFPHAGRCYDQIGAMSIAGGAAAGGALSVAVTAGLQHLHGQALTVVPDPGVAGVAIVVGSTLTGGWRLYRHWLEHRATVDAVQAITDEINALFARVHAGEADPAELDDLFARYGLHLVDEHDEPTDDLLQRELAPVAGEGA